MPQLACPAIKLPPAPLGHHHPVAADHVDRLIEAIRGNPWLHQMMKAAVDVDDAIVMANQAGTGSRGRIC